MTKNIQTEAAARAITNRTELTPAEQQDKQKQLAAGAAKRSLEKRREALGGDDHGFMEGMRSTKKETLDVPTADDAEKVIESAANTPEQKSEAKKIDAVLRAVFSGDKAYLEEHQNATSDSLIAPIREMMRRDPAFKELADAIDNSPASFNEWVQFVAEQLDSGRNPGDNRFVDNLQAKYKSFMEKDREESGDKTAIRRKLDMQKAKEDALNDQYQANIKEVEENRARKESFSDMDNGAGKELKEITDTVASEAEDRKRIEEEIAELRVDKARVDEDAHSTNLSIRREAEQTLRRLRTNISDKEKELAPFKKNIVKKESLTSEMKGLNNTHEKLLQDQGSLATQIETIREERTKIEKQLNIGGGKDKEDFVGDLRAIMGDAFRDTMIARFDAQQAGVSESFKELIAEARDPHVKAALEQLQDSHNRWKDWDSVWKTKLKVPYGRKEEPSMQKDLMKEDVDILLKEGPESFMRRFLSHKMDPDTKNAGNPQGMMYSKEKIDELISDKDFMAAVQPKAAGLLVRQAVQTNVLSERQMAELRDTEWGMSAIESALMLDKTAVESGRAHQAIDYIKKHPKFAWWMLLTFLWPPAGLFVAGVYAGKEVVSGVFPGKNKEHAGGHDKKPVNVEPPPSPHNEQQFAPSLAPAH
ncbi:MAG TPA: hypothetical protein PKA38_00785 [Candidatus Levybacteria bacterium]|nr:hypothetical protein [Candidatus Levybacteria bacterium]